MEQVDLVVIGAGIYGLSAAKTYLEINPFRCVVILEQASTVGGTWACHRLSPGIRTEYTVGEYECADFPLPAREEFGLGGGGRITGDVIQGYLERYVDRFHLRERIWFDTRVLAVEKRGDTFWEVDMVKRGGGIFQTTRLQARKLIVATGLLEGSSMPGLMGTESFAAPVMHAGDMDVEEAREVVLRPGDDEAVTVYGGRWAAQNVVSVCASAGRVVDWVIPDGESVAAAMALSESTTWTGMLQRLLRTRIFSLLSPCLWGKTQRPGFVARTLRDSWLGRAAVKGLWALARRGLQRNMSASRIEHPDIKRARVRVDPFYSGIPVPNPLLCAFVREGRVRIHVADIQRLSSRKVHLSTGHTLSSTGLILATAGTKPTIKFIPDVIGRRPLGMSDSRMMQTTHREILRHCPRLQKGETPDQVADKSDPSPDRTCIPQLARFMVPLSTIQERSIVFLGAVTPSHAPLIASTQALWAAAYLAGKLDIDPTVQCPEFLREKTLASSYEDLVWETALQTEYGALRYTEEFGGGDQRLQYEIFPYLDLLIRDLGLSPRRRRRILPASYPPSDYKSLPAEWRERNRGSDRLDRMESQSSGDLA